MITDVLQMLPCSGDNGKRTLEACTVIYPHFSDKETESCNWQMSEQGQKNETW